VTDSDVTVHVASYNTLVATELCIRSLRARAGYPLHLVVGDSGSRDGSVEMLRRLEAKGWLSLDVAPAQRQHAEWLDLWLATCPTDYAVFVDSDVEFRRRGWLARLVDQAKAEGAALVAAEMVPETANYVEPVGGKTVRLAARPSPWLIAVDVRQVRPLAVSFAFRAEPAAVPEGLIAYDVGGILFRSVAELGLRHRVMPPDYQRWFRHYGGLSWLPGSGAPLRKRLDVVHVGWRLRWIRRTNREDH